MILQHITNPNSPETTIPVTNPGYLTQEELQSLSDEERRNHLIVWGDSFTSRLTTMKLNSLSYCGAVLERKPYPPPVLLYECVNYTVACSILDYPKEEICWECVAILDAIRDKQGHGPMVEFLKKQDEFGYNVCICSKFVLMKTGCQCGGV
jgi:hypothetical protein